ncbi:UDP-galactopyranose mutase [Buttiauxella sp. BIGb0552]|uniref:UDP-galactopyranose mutase n=1 Tax=Buttiauxella sp. BIGb0552 TaxID=2485120 RepID=UPI0010652FEA|nr:UDP-galactopyranose mutase [Buttiauxella sp. BIGb0552]TDX16945.1 UDP-galactopyranose mutase [Buttiauxella sp. BIGb0552]
MASKSYDYLIVGSGLFGSICARELTDYGLKVKVIEKREHVGGNIYTEKVDGIDVHKYGAHIFHTNDKEIWNYINQFSEFNSFVNSPLAFSNGKIFNLPFNMNTFYQLWGVRTPTEAMARIEEQRGEYAEREPSNLEEQALALVGNDIYHTLIKNYTEKQWGRSANELPAFIIKRLPLRFTFDNNYFNDQFQGIPVEGYTEIINKMLAGIEVETNCDFFKNKKKYESIANNIIYTGPIDQYFDYIYGALDYRSLKFETSKLDESNHQGNAVINYVDKSVPYTRIIEHKHFNNKVASETTIVTKEYPCEYNNNNEPYYPINNEDNMRKYKKYRDLASKNKTVIFGGRLAEYKYYDMHQVIKSALYTVSKIKENKLGNEDNEQ